MAFDLDKESSFQDAMMGSAIGSIAHLNEGNLMLIKAFVDVQLKYKQQNKKEEKEES
tara:strand:- start:1360 stop:1530 length:171 start_codon:yes stop_codon:yes gene_type:complete